MRLAYIRFLYHKNRSGSNFRIRFVYASGVWWGWSTFHTTLWQAWWLRFPFCQFSILKYSNIPESPANGVFVSQLIRYARVCSKYEDFRFRGSILVSLKQGYSSRKLLTTFWKLYARHTDIVHKFETPLCHMCWMACSLTDIWLVSSYLG